MTREEEVSDFEDELKGITKEQKEKRLRKRIKVCFFCEKRFNVDTVEQTLRHKGYYRCKECFDANITKKVKYKEVKCSYCGIRFIDTYYTKKGLSEAVSTKKKCEVCRNKKIPRGPLPRPLPEYLECDLCGVRCRTKVLLYNHMDKHRSDVCCKVCGAKFTARSALRAHLRTHFEKFICDICGFTTNVTALFRNHNKLHTGIRPLKPRTYVKKEPEKGAYTCQECGIVYETKVGLSGHLKRQHAKENGINGFPCKVCGHVSYRMKEYRIHAISHSNKPLIFCHYPGCNMFYDRLKQINTHIRNVHKKSDDQYSCDTCHKTFKYKHSVNKHIRNNRCIPLKQRNLGRDSISKSLRDKSAEELERIARIAKEQYLEVRGSILILENQPNGESEEDILDESTEKHQVEETIINETAEHLEEEQVFEDSNIFDDFLDTSIHTQEIEQDEDVIAIKTENDNESEGPFVKIEIKTEPDIDALDNSIAQDDWHFLNDDLLGFKNDSEINELKIKLDPTNFQFEPYVLLERLDPDTIKEWSRPRDDVEPFKQKEKKEGSVNKYWSKERRLKLARLRQIAYDRRVKGEEYVCDVCGLKSKNKLILRKHMVTHKKYDRESKHPCQHCHESFPRYAYLKEHIRNIHKISQEYTSKDYICDLCGKDYYTITMLKYHLKVAHYALPTFQCSQCDKKFKTKAYMVRHENDVHDQIFRYPCVHCGKLFKRNHQLKVHELTHTLPLTQCKICGKMVKVMRLHLRTVHRRVKRPVELIPCPTCGKGFSKHNMQLHIDRAHLKLADERTKIRYCTQCTETFTRVDDLRRHDILVHFQGVPKQCPFEGCDSIFKKTKPLNVHIKNRHRGRAFYCQVCGKKFDTRSGLLKHTKVKGHRPNEEEKDGDEIEEDEQVEQVELMQM